MGDIYAAEPPKVSSKVRRFRCIVTGHDQQGRSVILSDSISPHVMPIMDRPDFAITDFWKTKATPADNTRNTEGDPCGLPIQVAPPTNGSVFRVVQFPPDREWTAKVAGGV